MRLLIDEMFPAATCAHLTKRGHDAAHVRDRGVDARPDRDVVTVAAREDRVLVTENVKDFAGEHELVIVCGLKSRLPAKGTATHLADLLEEWAAATPHPYRGMHWPSLSP